MIYKFLRKVAKILARKNADALFEYFIHSMDSCGGFMRSRYCYWEKELSNEKFSDDIRIALVSLQSPFDFKISTAYYDEEIPKDGTATLLKLQIFCYDLTDEKNFSEKVRWSACVGFSYPIKIDMQKHTYEILEKVRLS